MVVLALHHGGDVRRVQKQSVLANRSKRWTLTRHGAWQVETKATRPVECNVLLASRDANDENPCCCGYYFAGTPWQVTSACCLEVSQF